MIFQFFVSYHRYAGTICDKINQIFKEQDKSSDIKQQPPFSDRKIQNYTVTYNW